MKSLDDKNTERGARTGAEKATDPAIEFSIKLIDALEDKSQIYNETNPNSEASLDQLKKVYIKGVESSVSGSLNTSGLARVNMYLRYKQGGKISINSTTSTPSEIKGLVFETTSTKPLLSHFLDVTSEWYPEEEDFDKAKEDIEKYNLDYSFSSMDDIYLDSYEKLNFIWE